MAGRDIIVIGASAGGVEALTRIARALPRGFPASLFIVCHFPPGGKSVLPDLLSKAGPLLATHPDDGDPFHPGHIYVAPPDRHLLLEPGGRMRVTRGPRENHHRPAVDPLFRSAARHYGGRVIGVVLTGSLYDGAAGLLAVRGAGGLGVVQDPRDAQVAAMPLNATQIAGADRVVRLADLVPLLVELVPGSVTPPHGDDVMDPMERMPDVVREDMEEQIRNERGGELSCFSCPECGGTLWQVAQTGLTQFRCHVGHAYNGEALLAEQSETLEAALWTAVRTFREKVVLARQLATHERAKGEAALAARFEEQAAQAEEYAALIQKHVLGANGAGPPLRPAIQNSEP
jgi:two-component system, chemotaxis family, protein-glutamate methylesterase/glutaminase